MKHSEHTLGPWNYDDTWALVHGPKGEEICAVHSAQADDAKRCNRNVAYANAHLISAAPELLALANEFESYLELKLTGFRREYAEDHCIVQTAVRYLEQARAAISKANHGK